MLDILWMVDVSGGVCDLLGVVEDMEHNWLLQR
jgi:hypothetical protein